MIDRKVQWEIRPGSPERLGAFRTADGYNFAVELPERTPVSLLFYKKGSREVYTEIAIPEEYRYGDVWAVTVKQLRLAGWEYCYRQGEKNFPDPWAPLVMGAGEFGEGKDRKTADSTADSLPGKADGDTADRRGYPEGNPRRGGLLKAEKVRPLSVWIPFEDMIIYKVHVRGYTMQKNSRVKKKGTFQGLKEKITYFRELGVTSLELMPAYEFQEYPDAGEHTVRHQAGALPVQRLNYWGYAPGDYFAPKTAYCAGKDPEREVKEFLTALHEEGMECLMDFYFPGQIRPEQVQQVLRFWRLEYGVDGFVLMGEGVCMDYLAKDPVLADTKLLCPGLDTGRIYGNTVPLRKHLGEYNRGFQDSMRRFLKGDEDQISSFQYYVKRNPSACGVIQYMANHDGFTLADLVSFDYRHNEANGEGNRDGSSYNYSWNCGAEGPTRRTAILELRKRQMRNAVLLLMLSQGTPLLYGGDELGNSQEGNNNAYCQDNETGWVDWGKARKFSGFTGFVKDVIRFRKAHPILHTSRELRATDYRSLGWPEISFHSEKAWFVNRENTCREIGVLYCGSYAGETEKEQDDFIYVIYNMHWQEHSFALPDLPEGQRWHLAVDSGRKDQEAVIPPGCEIPLTEKKSLKAGPRRILVLIGKQG